MADRRVGLGNESTGNVDSPAALTRDGAQYVAAAHHGNVDAAKAGKTFIATTGIAGVAPGTTLTTTPPLALYNPPGSGVALALVGASLGYVSGTLGPGTIVLAGNPTLNQAVPTGGTALTAQCTYLGNVTGKGLAFQGATVAALHAILKPVFITGPFLATTADMYALEQRWEGSFLVGPGTCVSLQGVTVGGTTPLVILSLLWEEVRV